MPPDAPRAARPADRFTPVGLGGGGAMVAPAISPHDPSLLFVASDMGGVYRSTDGGGSWTMIDKRQLRDAGGCPVVFHPRDARVVWAAAKDSFKRSDDAGATWTALCTDAPWRRTCTALAIAEEDVDLLLAGGNEAAYRSVDGGRTWAVCTGVAGKVAGVAVLPRDATADRVTCLVATSAGVFRSEDRGATWTRSDAGLPAREVRALAAGVSAGAGTSIAYVTVANGSAAARAGGGVWRSNDRGTSWQRAGLALRGRPAPEYERIQTARACAETVYVTARNGHHVAVHRSDDAGTTWRAALDGEPGVGAGGNVTPGWMATERVWRAWGGASWGFAISPSDPRRAVFTNEGELYRTSDGGTTWSQAYAAGAGGGGDARGSRSIGLEVTSAWQLAVDPHDPARAYICYTDIGFARSVDRGATWRHATRGMPWSNTVYQLAFDPAVPGLLYAACSTLHDIPHWLSIDGTGGAGGVCASRDWGATWAPLGAGLPNLPATSIVLDPRSPPGARTLHVTQYGAGVYTSTDGGASWRPTAPLPGCESNRHVYRLRLCDDGTLYCTVTARRDAYEFAACGGLYRSRDGGRSWVDLTAALGLRWPGDVDTPPHDSTTIYLGVASAPGHTQGGVYKSVDDGVTWRHVLREDELPQALCAYAHAHFVTVDPRRPSTVYLGAITHGLFVSHDGGESWREVAGIPFTGCQRVAFDPADPAALWVTTFGAGVWKGAAPR
jgi:hypothetical protein